MTALDLSSPVAVVGTGTMGQGIAQVALVAGHPVRLYDAVPGRVREAVDAIGARLDRLVEEGRLGGTDRDAARARLRAAGSLADDLHLREPSGRYAPSLVLYRHAYASDRREGSSS